MFDGLEKVQDDGRRSGRYGHIVDGRLRNLLLDIAEGRFGHLAVVVTTRFDLYGPLAKRVRTTDGPLSNSSASRRASDCCGREA